MGTLKPGATYIYESPDDGKSTYAREVGADPSNRILVGYSLDMVDQLKNMHTEEKWMAILKESGRSPALQEAIDRVIIIYELSKTKEPVQWHPV